MRGNLCRRGELAGCRGSIPASAGEPWGVYRQSFHEAVYPRECGGTIDTPTGITYPDGLSPRVRGNPNLCRYVSINHRSIPASAGEPASIRETGQEWGVYPRECGGTAINNAKDGVLYGLSPRVRGNPSYSRRKYPASRSIPASAGEPRRCPGRVRLRWVYPRECGGTRHVANKHSNS